MDTTFSFGFILTRHVNSEKTNKYWNNAIRCIRRLYPHKKIIVIDDYSNPSFVKAEYEYKNVEYIASEFKGRGELLPYYYYIRNKWFDNAVIIHDSVFFHQRIPFESVIGKYKVLPLWHFNPDNENLSNMLRITDSLRNNSVVKSQLSTNYKLHRFISPDWYGCFGVQSFINHNFLLHLESKYHVSNLVTSVFCRTDRCALERIFAVMFFIESPETRIAKSLLGGIEKYCRWGYTYDEYSRDFYTRGIQNPIVKVWTGR